MTCSFDGVSSFVSWCRSFVTLLLYPPTFPVIIAAAQFVGHDDSLQCRCHDVESRRSVNLPAATIQVIAMSAKRRSTPSESGIRGARGPRGKRGAAGRRGERGAQGPA